MEKNWNQEGQGRILKIFDRMESALYIFAVSFMIIVNRSNLQAYSSAGNSNKATTGDIEEDLGRISALLSNQITQAKGQGFLITST